MHYLCAFKCIEKLWILQHSVKDKWVGLWILFPLLKKKKEQVLPFLLRNSSKCYQINAKIFLQYVVKIVFIRQS